MVMTGLMGDGRAGRQHGWAGRSGSLPVVVATVSAVGAYDTNTNGPRSVSHIYGKGSLKRSRRDSEPV